MIPRPNVAAQKIEQIGYERLRIYFLSRRDHSRPGKPFEAGTTYKNILRLYECDAKLRDVCFRGVGQFELVLRNRMSEVLSAKFGSHPYFNPLAFESATEQNKSLQSILHVFLKSRDERANHYRKTYTEPPLPPIWVLKEFLTFGVSANLYKSLATPIRSQIAKDFGIPAPQVFDSWIPCFVDLRNICAHHDRLFNRKFQKQPQRLKSASIPAGDSATLKSLLECLDFVLQRAGTPEGLVSQVQNVIVRYPEVRSAEVGY